jgi:predicted enzyme related to lactoylglutathione lyase
MITGINKVTLTVDEQAALEFWRDRVGFSVTTDVTFEGYRWIEVTSPNGAVVLAVLARDAAAPLPGSGLPDDQPTSPAVLATDDLQGTYRAMRDAGVEFVSEPEQQSWGWWSMFTDGQGNRIALVPSGQ